ncbi:Maltose operon periplasmic protein MalM [Vibrio chagasii]|uniref:MalM family protein n=1 Tax=Vibrio TaxID=662 RepID=UPI000CF4805F|nr:MULTISPECIES: MalM family protein [Vibrio]NOI93423.1 transcriptional regulator [Vibrio sp. T3Y01]PQJ51456.1 transcriptional regulator [Vibrio splendidus]CAH7074271.1 Maltose operon periplasmic protein MalM [Vibrio chagasii]CAH7435058.1 Maltose operon periplasmic protein MalM [Vibrio chagasii]
MYFKALMLSGCVALAGCQSAQVVEQVQVAQAEQVNSIAALQFAAMKLPSSVVFDVTPESQHLNYQSINSPVVAVELPANRGEYSLTISSLIGDTAFVPRAVIFDKNGKELESYGKDDFEYKKPRMHLGNRLVAEKEFFPPRTEDSVFLVVYTDQKDIGGFTDVIHPARLDAEGRGNYLPEVKDIPIPNASVGKVEVTIDKPSFFSFGSSSESNAKPAAAAKVEAIQPETQTYYHNAIKAAVEADNIPKALGLLDEAKALGIEGAQEVFVKAVNKK